MNCASCGAHVGSEDRYCTRCGALLTAGETRHETRRNVVIVFVDLVDSTGLGERLDPEPLRAVLDRYFAVCMRCVGEHGGTVEKFIGDAVMAVFGAPRTHEDDALRAVRAAAGIRAAVASLNRDLASHGVTLEIRVGICSGEVVVTSFPSGDLHVVGDAVNTAARLQAAARSGQILLNNEAALMARTSVLLEPVPALQLKGKAERTRAWQLVSLTPEAVSPVSTAFVGRADELEQLERAYLRSSTRRQCCLVTVLGEAGVGKSRLVREFVARLPAEGAPVLVGHCHTYGAGRTYDPVLQMLDTVRQRVDIESLLAGEADRDRVVRALSRLDEQTEGNPGAGVGVGVAEISWAVRRLFEVLARQSPLIAVWEDLHSAESTLLDLVDEVATWLIDVPVLLVCVARPELLETRPAWGGGKPCATTLDLPQLSGAQTAQLVAELTMAGEVVGHGVDTMVERVVEACDGNPLFAELMVDLIAEGGSDALSSPNINALLTARLDQLPAAEREVLERAAVVGREFTLEQVCLLLDDAVPAEINDRLAGLARRRLVRRGDRAGVFRFAQALVRDRLYAMTPKSDREEWHLRMADAVSGGSDPGGGNGDVLGYHLEAACLLRRELNPGDPDLPRLAARAAGALIKDGIRSLHRKDLPAAAAILERGRSLLPPGDPAHRSLALQICDSWLGLADASRALHALSAAEQATAGDERARLGCEVQRLIVALRTGSAAADIAAQADRLAVSLAADPDDDLTWCRFHQLAAFLHIFQEEIGAAEKDLRAALGRARAMADRYEEDRILGGMCELALWGPTPVEEGLALCRELADRFAADRTLLVPVVTTQAGLLALVGDLAGARRLVTAAGSHVRELHLDLAAAVLTQVAGLVESLAGNHAGAETEFRRGAAALRAAGKVTGAQTLEAWAARELFAQGRMAEAAAAAARLGATANAADLRTQLIVRALRGRLASAGGEHDAAVGMLDEAVRLARRTDDIRLQGDLHFDLAHVLRSAGRTSLAVGAAGQAFERYGLKGAELLAQRLRGWLVQGDRPEQP